jgi:hypothetical protein
MDWLEPDHPRALGLHQRFDPWGEVMQRGSNRFIQLRRIRRGERTKLGWHPRKHYVGEGSRRHGNECTVALRDALARIIGQHHSVVDPSRKPGIAVGLPRHPQFQNVDPAAAMERAIT